MLLNYVQCFFASPKWVSDKADLCMMYGFYKVLHEEMARRNALLYQAFWCELHPEVLDYDGPMSRYRLWDMKLMSVLWNSSFWWSDFVIVWYKVIRPHRRMMREIECPGLLGKGDTMPRNFYLWNLSEEFKKFLTLRKFVNSVHCYKIQTRKDTRHQRSLPVPTK